MSSVMFDWDFFSDLNNDNSVNLDHKIDIENSDFLQNCSYVEIDNLPDYKAIPRGLNVIHINIHSIPDKFDKLLEILTYLQRAQISPDIILVCETFLKD